jgi:AraC family transcriptional regulator of adaptative response/methylated-DNA-[protein]-cysteine methyltransferase
MSSPTLETAKAETPSGESIFVAALVVGGKATSVALGLTRDAAKGAIEASAPEGTGTTAAEIAHRIVSGQRTAASSTPHDARGTEFQKAVWNAACLIPEGEVRTYGEIAASIGRPKAFRAVASALAANRIAILIPCHRVVPAVSDAGHGGFRWGSAIKTMLIELERAGASRIAR